MERDEALAAVIDAIKDEGPQPAYHREVMARHRKEWPALWDALDELVRAAAPLTAEDAERARRFAAYLTRQSPSSAEVPTATHAPQATTSAYDIR